MRVVGQRALRHESVKGRLPSSAHNNSGLGAAVRDWPFGELTGPRKTSNLGAQINIANANVVLSGALEVPGPDSRSRTGTLRVMLPHQAPCLGLAQGHASAERAQEFCSRVFLDKEPCLAVWWSE